MLQGITLPLEYGKYGHEIACGLHIVSHDTNALLDIVIVRVHKKVVQHLLVKCPTKAGKHKYCAFSRDEIYGYGTKFARDRLRDRSFGRSRGNFIHVRDRGWGWGQGRYSGCDFQSYGGVADYPFRHKRTAPAWESANARSDYDGAAFGTNRKRKPLNDDLPSSRHPPACRQSPSGREDVAMIGTQMLRRAPRNIITRRCTGEDGFAYVGVRHSEKFNRDFPADISSPVYSQQQSMHHGPDSNFAQGDTEFTVMQRRGFPCMWSKFPVRSHTWSFPPRRLTEGLNGHQDLSQHMSPAMYRRSPPDQVFTRTNRPRVEISDHHERADGVGYFDGLIHTSRFPEYRSGERSKYGER
ncbi:hypothetical protein H5410_021556 [Solanum commersonii]|uniref:Uncharacterized protein n=1 Tax=Solanum commersonii TaxID=4109 RepID=A0A9J5ZBC2_SOLCO|nr:hypothetical protein H5410_021556 [Solanum commersonii]